jgi:hypothetical protein
MKRCYYPASPTEKDTLMCWIPADELRSLLVRHGVAPHVVVDHPLGLEIEVSSEAFEEIKLNLDVLPEQILREYNVLRERGRLAASGMVDGAHLESQIQVQGDRVAALDGAVELRVSRGLAPEPEMSPGDPSEVVFRRLGGGRGA